MTTPATRMDTPTYERFRDLVRARSGLYFPDKRRADLERGVSAALARSDCADLEAYYRLLAQAPTNGPVWEQLIGQVTIGETYFFRDRGQIEALRQHILPDIIAQKRRETRQIRIWSAGCSSGEEPYSIAILLREILPDIAAWNITILATDINREALNKARAGRYTDWSFREPDREPLHERYFTRQGQEWQLDQKVRDMVTLAYLNLGEDPYPSVANNTVAFDLIVCRNVTIYFVPEMVQTVVDRLHEALVESGWLIVGHAEPTPVTYARFQSHSFPGAIVYQKSGRPPPVDLAWLQAVEQKAAAAPPPAVVVLPPPPPPAVAPPPPPAVVPLPPPPADITCAEVESLLAQGRVDQALEELRGLLERDPHCAPAYLVVAKIQANAGRWEEARRWCQQALAADPLLSEAHFLLSLVHGQEGDNAQAIESMKRVVYLDREAVIGHFCLANLYAEVGQADRARKSLQNAARLLEKMPAEIVIPWSDGMTAGRLRYTIRRRLEE